MLDRIVSTQGSKLRQLSGTLATLFALCATGPAVAQNRTVATYSLFQVPSALTGPIGSLPGTVANGPDGNIWFSAPVNNQVGRVTLDGAVTLLPVPTAGALPEAVSAGPDGNVWFSEQFANQIARISTKRPFTITEFPLPSNLASPFGNQPGGLVVGSDGRLWFTEGAAKQVGAMDTTTLQITEYPLPAGNAGPGNIIALPDGTLWFDESNDGHGNPALVRFRPQNPPVFSVFSYVPDGPIEYGGLAGLAYGLDGNIWIAGGGTNDILRITPRGTDQQIQASLTDFSLPTAHSLPSGITLGPDGKMWFTEKATTHSIGRIDYDGTIHEYPLPTTNCALGNDFGLPAYDCEPNQIILGGDGNLWIGEAGANTIARVNVATPKLSGNVPGRLVVHAGETMLLRRAHVHGDVIANGSAGLFICGSEIDGDLVVTGSTGWGYAGNIGIPSQVSTCAPNRIRGSVTISANRSGFALGANVIDGNVTVTSNVDAVFSLVPPSIQIEANTIRGVLDCARNAPVTPGDQGLANTALGGKLGQCAGL